MIRVMVTGDRDATDRDYKAVASVSKTGLWTAIAKDFCRSGL